MNESALPRELAIFLGLVLFTYATIGRDLTNPIRDSEWARIATTFALVEKSTLAIDDYVSETADWSSYRGHYYSAKAPGPALMAAPFYYVQHAIQGNWQIRANDAFSRNLAIYTARLVTTTLPSLFALALLYWMFRRRFSLSSDTSLLLCGAWAVGSLGMVYASVYFGHQTSAAFLAIGMALPVLEFLRERPRPMLFFAAGLSMGIAVASDYMSTLAVALWTLWLLWRAAGCNNAWRLRLAWIAGGAVIAVILGWYHHACFGSFLVSPVSSKVVNPRWVDLNTLGYPDIGRLFQITILPWRGLFFASPVWILSLAGIYRLWRGKQFRQNSEVVVAAVTLCLYFGVLCMLPSAYGGWCLGPRYAVCALPMMLPLLIWPAQKWPRIFVVLLVISGVMMLTASLAEPLAPQEFGNPWTQFIFPKLFTNSPNGQYNIFGFFGATLLQSLALYALIWTLGIRFRKPRHST